MGTGAADPRLCRSGIFGERGSNAACQLYEASGRHLYMNAADVLLSYEAPLLAVVQNFASDVTLFHATLDTAWRKLMIADRFDGPAGNLCVRDDRPLANDAFS